MPGSSGSKMDPTRTLTQRSPSQVHREAAWGAKDDNDVGPVLDRWQKFRCYSANDGLRLWPRSRWRGMSVGFNSAVLTETAYAGIPLVLQPNSADGSFPGEASDGQPLYRAGAGETESLEFSVAITSGGNDGTFVTKILHGASLQLFHGTFLLGCCAEQFDAPFLDYIWKILDKRSSNQVAPYDVIACGNSRTGKGWEIDS